MRQAMVHFLFALLNVPPLIVNAMLVSQGDTNAAYLMAFSALAFGFCSGVGVAVLINSVQIRER